MIPTVMTGVWAAERVPAPTATWVPATPLGSPAHYFLVVSKGQDGKVHAFIRNPEFNAGASFGTRDTLPSPAPDGTLTISTVTSDDPRPLTFHRASRDELRWFYPREAASWTYEAPAKLNDGWSVGTLGAVGMDEGPIRDLIEPIVALRSPSLRSPYIHSIAIERHGELVLDEYFYGFTADTPHDVRSAGKSVTTLLVGRGVEDSHRFSTGSRVLSLLPQYASPNDDARKQAMTVADLMTMSSGLACDDNDDKSPGNEDTMQSQPSGTDWYRYTLDLPMISEPGTHAVYCSAGINLLGAIVATQTHMPLTTYFAQRFAIPMQFGTYAMWLMPAPAPFAYMGGGDYFRPRDFLKFGALMLNGGRWNGREILARSWIDDSIVPRSAPEGEGDRYGYGWHLTNVDVDGSTYEVINAGGNGGQLMIVLPKLDVAIMVTAGNYNQYPVWSRFLTEMVTAVVRSCAH